MKLELTMNDHDDLKPRITVFGVGGAGGNAVNNMIDKQLEGVEFVVANTDAQALAQSKSASRVQIGPKVTEGLGAGAKPAIGAAAAEETIEDIVDHLVGAHMCFITAGMGGGTGTGAAPIIAQAAREMGILTVGVVTKPFMFEGNKRMRQAEEGIENLQKVVDTLIIIPNQNLFRLANEKTTFTEAFALADDVLYQGVKGVTDLMVRPGLINLDFADVRAVMDEMGKAMMGTGEASGENRAVQAAEKAIANPLLDEISLNGAKGVLINVTGGFDMTLFELDEAATVIREKVDPDANIIVGSTMDPGMEGTIRVSVVATGIDASVAAHQPVPRRQMSEPLTQHPQVGTKAEDLPPPPPRREAPVEAATAYRPQPMQEESLDLGDDEDMMPRPGYQPKPAQAPSVYSDAADFTIPTRPRAEATDAAKERLSRILNRTESAEPAPQRPEPQAEAPRQQSRMHGLGKMFERVTGQHETAKPAPATMSERIASRVRAQQEADFEELEQNDAPQDRVEIPAFLRRQAN